MPRPQHALALGHPAPQPGLASLFVKKIDMTSLKFVIVFGMASLFVKKTVILMRLQLALSIPIGRGGGFRSCKQTPPPREGPPRPI